MPSLRSRLFVFTLKHRHLLQFKRKRPATVDWNTSIPQLRQETEAGAGFFGKFPADLRVTPVAIGDLHGDLRLNGLSSDVKLGIREFPVLGQISLICEGATGGVL